MPEIAKGVYPVWIGDLDIVNQVLEELSKNEGKLPYDHFINIEHDSYTKERMQRIIAMMAKEHLIFLPEDGRHNVEINYEGRKAIKIGYRRYLKQKHSAVKVKLVKRVLWTLLVIFLVAASAFFIAVVVHVLKARE